MRRQRDTPGYETPAGTILIAISRQTLSFGFFPSNNGMAISNPIFSVKLRMDIGEKVLKMYEMAYRSFAIYIIFCD